MKFFRCTEAVLVASLCFLSLVNADTTQCTNPPPGVRKMVRGVDITTLDIVPLSIIGSGGFKSPVVMFTCNGSSSKRWRNPQGVEYQLPDQVWHMTTLPGGWLSADVSLHKTYKDVRNRMTTEVGGEGIIKKFAFSASASYTKMQNTLTNSSRYISDVSAFDSATRVDFIPSWVIQMDRFAQMFVDRMITGTFASNPSAYNRFINEFGTHFFSTGNFGGYIRIVLETKESYFYSKTDTEAKANAKASFLKVISVYGGRVSGSTTVDETFKRETSETIRYFGGDTNLLTANGISRWQPTVDSDPWLFSGQLKPISDLIVDPVKKSSMIQAVENHVMRSYLNELERLVNTAKSKTSDYILNTLESRIKATKLKSILVESDVETLGRDVEEQILVPDWFFTNTQLCFKWWDEGHNGQCERDISTLRCAKPNTMTSAYKDDTDNRHGGCQMSWGIQSTGYPPWFNQVKICYQSDKNSQRGQCQAGGKGTLHYMHCAGINEFTPQYRDDTDQRSGGCSMLWRIDVPSTAPLWLRKTKLCFHWYPEDDGRQCQGSSRDLCALVNHWTESYYDDTDNRSGGCIMSWGLKLTL